MLDTPLCHVCYRPDLYIVYMDFKAPCRGDDYQNAFYYALYLLKEHRSSHLVINISSGFSTTSEDVEWTLNNFMSSIFFTYCTEIVFIRDTTNVIFSSYEMLTKGFLNYFMVHQCTSFKDAIDILY